MKDNNYLALDGHSLHIFLTVLEQGSVASAADKLGVTRTVIGNSLTRLRSVFQDPLFVRTGGQEIVATARAERMADNVRSILAEMQHLAVESAFDPKRANLSFTIGTNDFQRDMVLPVLYRLVSGETRSFSLRTLIAEYPSVELLRTGKADLLLSPVAPEGLDIFHKRLFIDHARCFFDEKTRQPPRTLADFRQAQYVGLNLEDSHQKGLVAAPISRELEQRVAVRVPTFSDMLSFIRGSELLALAPGMLRSGALASLSSVKVPFNMPSIFTFMLWHKRHQGDPAHQWMRTKLEVAVSQVMQQVRTAR